MAVEMVRKKIKHKGMPPRCGMLLSSQQLPRVHTDSGDFITKVYHHQEEFLKRHSPGSQNCLPKQTCASALQAECDVLSEGEVNYLE